jgi:hypothetical protein
MNNCERQHWHTSKSISLNSNSTMTTIKRSERNELLCQALDQLKSDIEHIEYLYDHGFIDDSEITIHNFPVKGIFLAADILHEIRAANDDTDYLRAHEEDEVNTGVDHQKMERTAWDNLEIAWNCSRKARLTSREVGIYRNRKNRSERPNHPPGCDPDGYDRDDLGESPDY